MARVFLNDETYNAASDDAEINGSAGTEQVNVFAGVTGLDVTSSVERVDLSGDIADFTFSSFGNSVTILDGNGDTVAAVSGADGKQLVFGDGALDVAFDAGTNELTVGGETVDGNAAAITPAASEIDATTTSESANGGGNGGGGAGGGGAAQTFTLTESANTVAEGDTVTYTVTADSAVTADTTLTVSVSGSDLNGAATAASATDYTLSDTSVTFADGAAAGSTQTFTVTANTDDVAEGVEGIKVSLLDDSFATVASETTAITNVESAQTFVLTNDQNQTTGGADNFTGTAQDDTFIATADGALGNGDVIDGAGGTDTLNARYSVDGDVTVNASVSNVEQLNIDTDNGAGTDDELTFSAAFAGLQEVRIRDAAQTTTVGGETDITVNQIALGTDVAVENGDGAFEATFAYASATGASDVATINLDAADVDTVTIANIETLTLNAENGDSEIDTLTTAAATALNITGTGGLTVTDVDDATVTIDGTAATGDVSLAGIGTVDATVTLGSGDDTIAMGASLDGDDTIDGGDGADTVEVDESGAAAATTLTLADLNLTSIEALQVEGDAGNTTTVVSSGQTGLDTITFIENNTDNEDLTVNDLAADVAVGVTSDVAGQSVGTVNLGLEDASGNADELSLTLNGTTGQDNDVDDLAFTDVETLSITSTRVDATANALDFANNDENLLGDVSSDTTLSTINASGADALSVTVGGEATNLSTIDASGMTAEFRATVSTGDLTVTGGSDRDVINFGTTLNNDDTIDLGDQAADTEDTVNATINGLTATTGALSIDGAEVVNLDTAGAASTIDATGITGAARIGVASGQNVTFTGLSAAASVGLGISDADDDYTGTVDITLADETGGADSVAIDIIDQDANNAVFATLVSDSGNIESATINVGTDDDGVDSATLDIDSFDVATITLTNDAAAAANFAADTLTLGTLSTSTTTLDASAFAGIVSATASTSDTSVSLTGDVAHDVTGGTGDDTFTVAELDAAVDINVDGAAGDDTLTITLGDDGAGDHDFSDVDNFEIYNISVAASADATVTDFDNGADVAETIAVSGGNSLSSFTSTDGNLINDGDVTSFTAAGFTGAVEITVDDNTGDDTFIDTTLSLTGGDGSSDVLNVEMDDEDTSQELVSSAFETVDLLIDADSEDNEDFTVDVGGITGASTIEVRTLNADDGNTITLSDLASGVTVALGNGDGGFDGSSVTANLASTAGGSTALEFDVVDTANNGLNLVAAGVEALTLDFATGNALDHQLNLSGIAVTSGESQSIVFTGGNGNDVTIDDISDDATSLNASASDNNFTLSDRGSSALEVTMGSGDDSIRMENAADVLTGGDGTDTLEIVQNAVLGGFQVDLSATGDQVTTYNGAANAAVQSGFENVDLSGITGTNGADITANANGSTITGTSNADQITGGAGADTVNITQGDDVITGGAGSNTLGMVNATNDGIVENGDAAGNVINLNAGTITFDDAAGVSHSQTITGFVNVDLSSQDDAGVDLTITGDGEANTITGGAGADIITGGAGDDTIDVDTGNDNVVYTASTDGGTAGTDSVGDNINNFTSTADNIIIDGALETDLLDGGDANLDNFEAGDADVDAAEAIDLTAANTGEYLFADAAESDLSAANLEDISEVATFLEDNFDITSADGEDALVVIEATGGDAGTFGIYYFEDTATNTGDFDAAEISLIGIVSGDAVVVGDITL